MCSRFLFGLIISGIFLVGSAFGQPPKLAARAITIVSEPNATVWIDDIKRGVTDENGQLIVKSVASGTRKMRVRLDGFKEVSMSLLPTQKGIVKVALVKTTDEAELTFQQAETLASTDKEKAVEMYRKAIALRPKFAEAHLGLARLLSLMNDNEGALKAIAAARKVRPAYAEASAVEGRVYKSSEEEEKAIASFKRAITEGKGFQPEARTGLGLLYKERAEAFSSAGDFANEKVNYELAATELKKAIPQLSDTPDAVVVYQLLGDIYEKSQKQQEAIALYEEFLRLFPESPEATAVRSFIVQLKKQMSEEQQ